MLRPWDHFLETFFFFMSTETSHNSQTKKSHQQTQPIQTPSQETYKYPMYCSNLNGKHFAHTVSSPQRTKKTKNKQINKDISNTAYIKNKDLPKKNNTTFNFKAFRQAEGAYFMPNSSKMLSVFQPD